MSFSCPHFRPEDEYCLRLKTDCVPGRPGCVLPRTSGYAVPVEERIRAKEEEKRLARATTLPSWPPKGENSERRA